MSDFYNKLNDAEMGYSMLKKVYSKENPFGDDALFSVLARNVSELSGNPMEISSIVSIMETSLDEYNKMNCDGLIREANKIL